MNDVYEEYFDYGPSIGQEITIDYTLAAVGSSSEEQLTGEITKANDERIIVKGEKMDVKITEHWKGTLYMYAHGYADGKQIGAVQDITEH